MRVINGGTQLSLSLAALVRHSLGEPGEVTAGVRGGIRQLGDHALETAGAQLGLPTLIVGSSI